MYDSSLEDSLTQNWNGLPLIATDHALDKMMILGMRLNDVAILLEYGNKCGYKRKEGKYEICDKWRGKEIKIVFSQSYSYWVNDMDYNNYY